MVILSMKFVRISLCSMKQVPAKFDSFLRHSEYCNGELIIGIVEAGERLVKDA